MLRHRSLRRSASMLVALSCLAVSAGACGGDSTTTPGSTSIAGNYRATVFQVTPTGLPMIDVLALGGTLTLNIAADNSTTGTLGLPAGIAGSAISTSLTGTAVQTGNTVKFQQTADTFVRDLTFTVNGNSLQATNQTAGSASFNIVLTRQ